MDATSCVEISLDLALSLARFALVTTFANGRTRLNLGVF
jgi:hypothetical protein